VALEKKVAKIAVVWGHGPGHEPQRFHTHHTYWEAALLEAGHQFVRFGWPEIPSIPDGFDFYFFPDYSNLLYRLPKDRLRPRAFFFFDAHHHPGSFSYPAQLAPHFDRVYFAELRTAEELKNHGFPNVEWLPPAFYPGVFRPLQGIPKVFDWAFVGQQDDVVVRDGDTKRSFIDRLSREEFLKGVVSQGVYTDAVNLTYNKAKVLFERTIFDGVGTRFFELLGSGGFVLMNRFRWDNGIGSLAEDGKHYVSYDGTYRDFHEKMRHYLDHTDERRRIAATGHAHVLAHHTYGHRVAKILSDFGLGGRP
jgi:hypothetical protein